MAFSRKLNDWCQETENKIDALDKAVTSIIATQKITLTIISINMSFITVILAAVLLR